MARRYPLHCCVKEQDGRSSFLQERQWEMRWARSGGDSREPPKWAPLIFQSRSGGLCMVVSPQHPRPPRCTQHWATLMGVVVELPVLPLVFAPPPHSGPAGPN